MIISSRLLALACVLAGGAGVARAHNRSDDALSAQVDEVVRAQSSRAILAAAFVPCATRLCTSSAVSGFGLGIGNGFGEWRMAYELVHNSAEWSPSRLTIATLMLDIETEWILNASLATSSSYRKCSKRRI
jgi:hypothetical protein